MNLRSDRGRRDKSEDGDVGGEVLMNWPIFDSVVSTHLTRDVRLVSVMVAAWLVGAGQ